MRTRARVCVCLGVKKYTNKLMYYSKGEECLQAYHIMHRGFAYVAEKVMQQMTSGRVEGTLVKCSAVHTLPSHIFGGLVYHMKRMEYDEDKKVA